MKASTMSVNRAAPAVSVESISIQEMVASASDVISPVWPLKTFIAVNPLQGLEHLPFEQAVVESARQRAVVSDGSPGREAVNRELIKWCSAYFDEGQATIAMPISDSGLYATFADLARYDARLNQSDAAASLLKDLPATPDDAIVDCLENLEISYDKREEFIRQSLAALPGWSGHVKWKEHWQEATAKSKRPATLVEYVAVRLILTRILWPEAQVVETPEPPKPQFLAELPASEERFRKQLLGQLASQAQTVFSTQAARPDAQLVFCIDVRSEPFRRAIEAQGSYETLGFAGFFGLPVQVKGYDDDHAHDSCPVLLKPRHTICEQPSATANAACIEQHNRGRSLLRMPGSIYHWLKYNFATPFALVEMLGPWLGLRMMVRTFMPSLLSRCADATCKTVMPAVPTEPALDGLSVSQQSDFGESALRLMGLTENLAPVVVLCAHGSSTTNNAYASALDCGACGGNHGGANARILAAILNNPAVRESLAKKALVIPADTLFVAAEHDTTTDHVEIYKQQGLPDNHRKLLDQLSGDLEKAQAVNSATRAKTFGRSLPAADLAVRETIRRSLDWAEVRPEWGLARNAAFVVGPRELSRSVDLNGRCFLHSYDWESDQTGAFLTTILTAPMVVAQWINSQYLFSTLDNVSFGAGSKVTQNVTGKLGVMQGNASDLMHGLPLQSVFAEDNETYHEPLRLLTVVYAPRSRLDGIIHTQDVLKKLFGNGWVTLACIDPTDKKAYRLDRDLVWQTAS